MGNATIKGLRRRVGLVLGAALIGAALLTAPAGAADERSDMMKQVGERAPIFQVVTSQGTLADYDRDYYGKHHLVMTFVPAAFTPV